LRHSALHSSTDRASPKPSPPKAIVLFSNSNVSSHAEKQTKVAASTTIKLLDDTGTAKHVASI